GVLVGFRRYRLRPAAANSTLTLRTRAGHLTRPFMRVSIRPKMAKVEMAFPEHFSGEHCQAAITTAHRWRNEVNWDAYLTDTDQGRLCAKKASQTAAGMQP
ncbi:hypothetical protein, partial [uncultured Thiodictyon sp.]